MSRSASESRRCVVPDCGTQVPPLHASLYEAPGPVHQIRVSPDGRTVAFREVIDGLTAITVIDRQKKKTTLSTGWLQVDGLAWARTGSELWLTGKRKDTGWGWFALTMTGKLRLLLRIPGQVRLQT